MGPVCTIMAGRLDDWLKVLLEKDNIAIDPGYLDWAGVAVFKTYKLFRERGYRIRPAQGGSKYLLPQRNQPLSGGLVPRTTSLWSRTTQMRAKRAPPTMTTDEQRRYINLGGEMTKFRAFFLWPVILVPLFSFAVNDEQNWKFPHVPSVKSITIGSSNSQVLKVLGQPTKRRKLPPSEVGIPASEEFHYPGFILGLYRSENEKEPHVWFVHVIGKGPTVYPGIKIGMTKKELVELLGEPYSDDARADGQWMFWRVPDPVEIFHVRLKNNRVVEFKMAEDWS